MRISARSGVSGDRERTRINANYRGLGSESTDVRCTHRSNGTLAELSSIHFTEPTFVLQLQPSLSGFQAQETVCPSVGSSTLFGQKKAREFKGRGPATLR